MASHNIYHDIDIKASPQRVFKAISQANELINWWPKKCSGQCQLGAIYNFYFTDEYDWLAQLDKMTPNEFIQFKMTRSDKDWEKTYFNFKLKVIEEKTRLTFSHCNWREINHHYRRSSYCWALLLKGLKEYTESGIILSFENRA